MDKLEQTLFEYDEVEYHEDTDSCLAFETFEGTLFDSYETDETDDDDFEKDLDD